MILADTSVWIDHLRKGVPPLVEALEQTAVLMHPFVVGELACGNLDNRAEVLGLLRELPAVPTPTDDEVLGFIERHALHGRGIGYVDAHLLTAVALAGPARLWTLDRRLAAAARSLDLAYAGSGQR